MSTEMLSHVEDISLWARGRLSKIARIELLTAGKGYFALPFSLSHLKGVDACGPN